MLPTEPKSQLVVSQNNKPMLNFRHKVVSNNSMRQFAGRTGKLIIKYPFWVLLIGSLGIHAAFALITANPLKKTPSKPEVIVSTLPVVKIPAQSTTTNSKTNKSLFDNLFVKPATNKLTSPSSPFSVGIPNTFDNASPNTSLRSLDLNTLEHFEDLSPLATDLPLEAPPLLSTAREVDPPQFVKPQISSPLPQTTSSSRLTPSGQIDNTIPPNKTTTNSSNLKPEFSSGVLKNEPPVAPVEPKSTKPKTTQGSTLPSPSSVDMTAKEIDSSINSLYKGDKLIADLVADNLIKNTLIAPEDAPVSYPDKNREKGVAWIPVKNTENIFGKRGSVIFRWLVAPDGEIKRMYYTPSKDKDLDNIVLETVKDYKFKPIEDLQSGTYRLVTAKYDFPRKY